MVTTQYIISAIISAANAEGIDPNLLMAIAKTESSVRPHAVNYGDAGKGKSSFGLFQLNHRLIVHRGGDIGDCETPMAKKDRIYKNCKWFGAQTNANFAAKYIKELIVKYDNDMVKVLCHYNRGSLRYSSNGFCVNFKYVEKVRGNM